MGKTHKLKTVQPFYNDIVSGKKPFEIRLNDRDFKVGDYLILQEFDTEINGYTGKETYWFEITYILDNPKYCKDGYIVMGIRDLSK